MTTKRKKRTTRNSTRGRGNNNDRNTNNPQRVIFDNDTVDDNPSNNNTDSVQNYAQLQYFQNRLKEFTADFIKHCNDTYRWILDIRAFERRNHEIPERFIFDKVIDKIPIHERQLLDQYIMMNDDMNYSSINTLKKWAKFQYPPSKSIQNMIEAVHQLQHRRNENPLAVYNTWSILVNTINLIADEINTELTNDAEDEDEDIDVAAYRFRINDREKYRSLCRLFIVDNNNKQRGNTGRVNRLTSNHITKRNPKTLQSMINTINELPDIIQPIVQADAHWNQYVKYPAHNISAILFEQNTRNSNPSPNAGSAGVEINIYQYNPNGGRGGGRGRGRGRGRGGYTGRDDHIGSGSDQSGNPYNNRGRGGYRGQRGFGGRGRGRGTGNGRGRGHKRSLDASFGANNDIKRRRIDGNCYRCGKWGHPAAECKSAQHPNDTALANTTCYRCGDTGHLQRDCVALYDIDDNPIFDPISVEIQNNNTNQLPSDPNAHQQQPQKTQKTQETASNPQPTAFPMDQNNNNNDPQSQYHWF